MALISSSYIREAPVIALGNRGHRCRSKTTLRLMGRRTWYIAARFSGNMPATSFSGRLYGIGSGMTFIEKNMAPAFHPDFGSRRTFA